MWRVLNPVAATVYLFILATQPASGQTNAKSPCAAATSTNVVSGNKIAELLKKDDFKKNDLETTVEYTTRIAPTIAAFRALSVSARGELFVQVHMRPAYLKYNADTEKMVISNIGGVLVRDTDESISVYWREQDAGGYEATNAFGARLNIAKRTAEAIYITAPKMSLTNMIARKDIQFVMPRSEATSPETNLIIAVALRLKAPYFISQESRTKPTIDFPYDYAVSKKLIYADILCAVLINRLANKTIRIFAISQL